MRVLICNWKDIEHPAAGGAEVYTHEVARAWAAKGVEVTVFAAAAPGLPAEAWIDGVRIVRAGGRYGVYRAARDFHAGEGRWDLVIDEVNTRPFNCAGWAGDTPVVALIHQICREIWFQEMPLPVALAGRFVLEPRWLRALRDVPVLTVSPSSRDSLAGYGLRQITVVPEGIHRRVRPDVWREQHPTLAFVGRLTPSKRPYDALAAFKLVQRRFPAARLWMIGDGPLRAGLEAAAPPGVTIFGRVPEDKRDELLARAHVLVATSVREGWGLVVDEAAAMGTPAATYDVPGLRDSVRAAGGALTPPRPAALAAALCERLPQWTAMPAAQGWRGGAEDWDMVALKVFEAATASIGLGPQAMANGGTKA